MNPSSSNLIQPDPREAERLISWWPSWVAKSEPQKIPWRKTKALKHGPWSDSEDTKLKFYYPQYGTKLTAQIMGRGYYSVVNRLELLKRKGEI